MEQQGYEAARRALEAAQRKLAIIASTAEIKDVEEAWSEFLTIHNRVWTKLRIATNQDPVERAWMNGQIGLRDADPLMSYVAGARHADEHGVKRIASVGGLSLTINAANPTQTTQIGPSETSSTGGHGATLCFRLRLLKTLHHKQALQRPCGRLSTRFGMLEATRSLPLSPPVLGPCTPSAENRQL